MDWAGGTGRQTRWQGGGASWAQGLAVQSSGDQGGA